MKRTIIIIIGLLILISSCSNQSIPEVNQLLIFSETYSITIPKQDLTVADYIKTKKLEDSQYVRLIDVAGEGIAKELEQKGISEMTLNNFTVNPKLPNG